jgi:hypothetical protein
MHTVSVNLYTFDELAPKVQQNVVDCEIAINVEDHCWYSPIIKDSTRHLQSLGFEDANILFSGFGSQGDGACFEARINIAAYLRAHTREEHYSLLSQYPDYVEASLKHSGRYAHEFSTHLVPYFNAEAIDPNGTGIAETEAAAEKEYEALEEEILRERITLGRAIYKALEKEYFNLISDESVRDALIANEFTYLSDGRRFAVSSGTS